MTTASSGGFITNQEWFRSEIKEDVVLRGVSALECLGMFDGYMDEVGIDVYALEKGEYANIDYRIIGDFDEIESVKVFGLRCTSERQTINDLLSEYWEADPQPLVEALNLYYQAHGMSFDGLDIEPGNIDAFEDASRWAIEYYSEG